MNPFISVIVPVYQVEQYIENTMKSICNQTYKDFEVILVNDGTKDNSIEIAENILVDSKIRYKIINQQNKGLSAARNTGIINSSGDWVVCVDSDDVINKDFLKILYESCLRFKVDISIGNFQKVNYKEIFKLPNKISDSIIIEKEEILNKFLVRELKIIVPAILMKKEFIINNNLFYDENIKFSEDQHYIWRVLFSTERFAFNETPIYNYFLRPNSIMTSSSIEKILTGYEAFIELTSNLNDKGKNNFGTMVMARWIFGVLHSSSKILDYKNYKILLNKINYKEYFNNYICFQDKRIFILMLILKINRKLFYRLMRIL